MTIESNLKALGINNFEVIDKQAIKEITLGSSILATGGGGDPDIGLLWADRVIDEGHQIVLVNPNDIPDEMAIVEVGCLGAPIVLTEKPPSGKEIDVALNKLSKYMDKNFQGIVPPEAGGVNMIVPMAVAGSNGIPVIDADSMGRAFPEFQMSSFYINGVNVTPVASANEKGYVTITHTNDGLLGERIIRSAAMGYGGISWYAGVPMSGEQLKKYGIPNTVSLNWKIGKAVFRCREENRDPLYEILDITGGSLGFKGKVTDINREFGSETNKGFSIGRITMEGLGEFSGSKAHIDFQNEWLILYVDGKPKCITPDLIIIIDPETGEPIRTDIIKYGYRGNVLIIPANERLRIPKGIETFGPRYFGYDIDYTPVEMLEGK